MNRLTIIPLWLLLCPTWAVMGQQPGGMKVTIQGGQTIPAPRKVEQGTRSLTNDSIVKLVKAGLDENTVISIVSTQPGKYSLKNEDVLALKKAGVSEEVIAAMRKKAGPTATTPTHEHFQIHVPSVADQFKPPSPPDGPGLHVPGPDDPAPPTSERGAEVPVIFNDEAYHSCLGRDALMTVMTPEQKAAFKDDGACQFSSDDDRAYHECLEAPPGPRDLSSDGSIQFSRLMETPEGLCAEAVRNPRYRRSHPATIPITKVRKVYVDTSYRRGIERMIRKETCLQVVDSRAEADAVIGTRGEQAEYDGTEAPDIDCIGSTCTDGVTVVDQTGVHRVGYSWFTMVDPHSNKVIEGWGPNEGLIWEKGVWRDLGNAVGCGKGN